MVEWRKRTGAYVAGLAAATALGGCMPTDEPPDPAQTYERFCAVCHGQDGKANTGTGSPQLNNATLLASATDEYLARNIAQGRPGTTMSVFGEEFRGPMSRAEIDAVVTHIRQWETPGLPTPSPVILVGDADSGEDIYASLCASCHGTDGISETAPDLANTTFQSTANDEFIRYAIVYGRPDTLMEPIQLTEQELADVIAYVRLFGEP